MKFCGRMFVLVLFFAFPSFAGSFIDDFAASPYASFARDYFARFALDITAVPGPDEIQVTNEWRIVFADGAVLSTRLMVGHLGDFLRERLGLDLPVTPMDEAPLVSETEAIVLLESGGGEGGMDGSFSIRVSKERVIVAGNDPGGLRDGVVALVDKMGFREAPIMGLGDTVYRPRQRLRVGFRPVLGTMRDVVFHGNNAVTTGLMDFYKLSSSQCIAELATLQDREYRERVIRERRESHQLGIKTYCYVHTMTKFKEDAPVLSNHPEIRGVRTWQEDGLFTLCTEAPLVKQYLKESVQGLFRDDPELDGLLLIIGGEGFYHCYMRPYGVEPGDTTCARCKALGADTVVANLCNWLAESAREVNPEAEIVVWPYSAMHVWSSDKTQAGFIRQLKPGVALLTEIEKDEVIEKAQGVRKAIWDYSIDYIGPGPRALEQIALCRDQGIPVYLKSEPELAFEASGLPHIPCMDRWAARAEALAASGATGSWVFPAFLPHRGTSTAEVYKYFWWDPVPEREALLDAFARRIAGKAAGPGLREAWRLVSEAIGFSPEIAPYYNGPHYLGPAHPMCVDPDAQIPLEFYGRYGYYAEVNPELTDVQRPAFVRVPTGNTEVFPEFYRQMEVRLKKAVAEIEKAAARVDKAHRLGFDSEASIVRWFYHIARTEANFYDAFRPRQSLGAMVEQVEQGTPLTREQREMAQRLREILADELENAREALPVMESDMRLDFAYMGFCPGVKMLRKKIELLEAELEEYLPRLEKRLGL